MIVSFSLFLPLPPHQTSPDTNRPQQKRRKRKSSTTLSTTGGNNLGMNNIGGGNSKKKSPGSFSSDGMPTVCISFYLSHISFCFKFHQYFVFLGHVTGFASHFVHLLLLLLVIFFFLWIWLSYPSMILVHEYFKTVQNHFRKKLWGKVVSLHVDPVSTFNDRTLFFFFFTLKCEKSPFISYNNVDVEGKKEKEKRCFIFFDCIIYRYESNQDDFMQYVSYNKLHNNYMLVWCTNLPERDTLDSH